MRSLIVVLFSILILSCASHLGSQQPITLDKYSQFVLQAVPSQLADTGRTEQLKISAPDQSHKMLLQIEIFTHQVKMVGFSLSGLVLFEMSWDQVNGLVIQPRVPLGELKPELLFAYFQLANWPVAAVRQGLTGLTLEIQDNRRRFYRDNQLVFTVESADQSSLFRHQLKHFQIEIDRLEQWKLNE